MKYFSRFSQITSDLPVNETHDRPDDSLTGDTIGSQGRQKRKRTDTVMPHGEKKHKKSRDSLILTC